MCSFVIRITSDKASPCLHGADEIIAGKIETRECEECLMIAMLDFVSSLDAPIVRRETIEEISLIQVTCRLKQLYGHVWVVRFDLEGGVHFLLPYFNIIEIW